DMGRPRSSSRSGGDSRESKRRRDSSPHDRRSSGRKQSRSSGQWEVSEVSPKINRAKSNSEHGASYTITKLRQRCMAISPSDVLMAIDSSFTMQGAALIECLHGEVEVYGHQLKANSTQHALYAPSMSSYPLFKARSIALEADEFPEKLRPHIEADVLSDVEKFWKENQGWPILIFSRLQTKALDYISNLRPFEELFCFDLPESSSFRVHEVGVNFSVESPQIKQMTVSDDQKNLLQNLCSSIEKKSMPKVIACGGKNVGKSTLVRIMVNSMLNVCQKVAHLECDVGQSEFTPSGCVSLTIIEKPLLGPPFTHDIVPLSVCFVGSLTPSDDPAHYINCVRYVYNGFTQLNADIPLVINTMGWSQGLGIPLLMDIIRICEPTHLLQLDCSTKQKNFPTLDQRFICDTPGLHLKEAPPPFEHLVFRSDVSPPHSSSNFKPVDLRNLTLLSYLSLSLPANEVSLCAMQPYQIDWCSVALHVCHVSLPRTQIMAAFNASVVALVHAPSEMIVQCEDSEMPKFLLQKPICECYGFGLVRAIDPSQKKLYLVTPLPLEVLKSKVNCLLLGALSIPTDIILNQKLGRSVPYVDRPKDAVGSSSIKRHQRLQRKYPASPK
ncbi:hypothetical protein CAPTEDRAFT_197373, partial [Capitella teleta]